MSNQLLLDVEPSQDTSPLRLHQLSDDELRYILEIEHRLLEARHASYESSPHNANGGLLARSEARSCFASVQQRFARTLLLDGNRGTGKTSLLLTLVRKWHSTGSVPGTASWATKEQLKTRLESAGIGEEDTPADHGHIRVVRIIDFDSLPREMPFVAGVVQAFRPMADLYNQPVHSADERPEEEPDTLMDTWHRLFRVAAVSGAAIPKASGLIEQFLDRQEQAEDWQRLAEDWQAFIWKLLERGTRIKQPRGLPEDTVFVVMIDDVDLQIARVRELLPALRLLYHPRVFFLVAADSAHAIDMLKLDFLGQQNLLGHAVSAGETLVARVVDTGKWAEILSQSAFEKVFPRRNRWKLERLSIREFVAFPEQTATLPERARRVTSQSSSKTSRSEGNTGPSRQFFADLNEIKPGSQSTVLEATTHADDVLQSGEPFMMTFLGAGDLVLHLAEKSRGMKLPGVMTYRAAEQLRQYVMTLGKSKSRPAEVLARLLSGDSNASAASVHDNVSDVVVSIAGELAALYRPGSTDYAGPYDVVLSARPDFVFFGADKSSTRLSAKTDGPFNFTTGLLAKALEEANFPVDASNLRWETYLSLAWTQWQSLGVSFAWTRHNHPRPDQLFDQTGSWSAFMRSAFMRSVREARHRLERYAYAWIYLQRRWSLSPASGELDPTILKDDAGLPWKRLLAFPTAGKRKGDEQELEKWHHTTLPLLARPELGFPPDVQRRFLQSLAGAATSVKQELRRQRRRFVTDAFVAARVQRGDAPGELPSDAVVRETIAAIDREYLAHHGKNWWADIVEHSGARPKRRTSSHVKK